MEISTNSFIQRRSSCCCLLKLLIIAFLTQACLSNDEKAKQDIKLPDKKQAEIKVADVKLPDKQQPAIKQADIKVADKKEAEIKVADVKLPDKQQPAIKQADTKVADKKEADIKQPQIKHEDKKPSQPIQSPPSKSARNQHPTCKQSEVEHSDIIHDRGLGNINPKNYTFLGNMPTMNDCMAMCCSTKHCNIAYMKNSSCFGVTCYDGDKCQVKNGTVESGTKLALMIRNEMNRRVYVTAYLVVVVCAFGAALSGTVWAMFVFYKKYSSTRPGDEEEESGLLKQPKVY